MILSNNPSIDVEALMNRVRAEAARLRLGGAIEAARRQRWDSGSDRLTEIIDRQNAIAAFLATAEHRNQPRTQVPARFAKLRGFAKFPMQFMLRVVNYMVKPQREVAAAHGAALRELTALVAAAARDVNDLNRRVTVLTERLEQHESNIDQT
jgi:hypothetical protein